MSEWRKDRFGVHRIGSPSGAGCFAEVGGAGGTYIYWSSCWRSDFSQKAACQDKGSSTTLAGAKKKALNALKKCRAETGLHGMRRRRRSRR